MESKDFLRQNSSKPVLEEALIDQADLELLNSGIKDMHHHYMADDPNFSANVSYYFPFTMLLPNIQYKST